MNLTEQEKRVLWIALNNMQSYGLKTMTDLLKSENKAFLEQVKTDWFKQGADEYHIINTLKAKLCGETK